MITIQSRFVAALGALLCMTAVAQTRTPVPHSDANAPDDCTQVAASEVKNCEQRRAKQREKGDDRSGVSTPHASDISGSNSGSTNAQRNATKQTQNSGNVGARKNPDAKSTSPASTSDASTRLPERERSSTTTDERTKSRTKTEQGADSPGKDHAESRPQDNSNSAKDPDKS